MVLGKDYADPEDLVLGMDMVGPVQVVLDLAGLVLPDLEMENPVRVELSKGKTFYGFKHATKEHKDSYWNFAQKRRRVNGKALVEPADCEGGSKTRYRGGEQRS